MADIPIKYKYKIKLKGDINSYHSAIAQLTAGTFKIPGKGSPRLTT